MSSIPIGNPVTGGGEVPGDVDALERQHCALLNDAEKGLYRHAAFVRLNAQMLAALRQQQADKLEGTIAKKLTAAWEEIARLRAELKRLDRKLYEGQDDQTQEVNAQLEKENARLLKIFFVVKTGLEREEFKNERLRAAIAFMASAIKSGEPWTDECEIVMRKALDSSDE